MKNSYEEILEYINTLQIIDSHEHLPKREAAREQDTDILHENLHFYFCRDLISAGLKPSALDYVRDTREPLMDRWKVVEPYWSLARNTGYGRALDLSVKGVYGFDRIEGATLEALNHAFLQTIGPEKNHFRRVLKDLCKIEYGVLDAQDDEMDCDPEFFRCVYRPDNFIYPNSWDEIERVQQRTGITIRSLDDWLEACERSIERALEKGAVALKSGLAYKRSLRYERTTRQDAEADFRSIMQPKKLPIWENRGIFTSKAFQDYMMHFVLRIADRKGLVFQFHTGLQEGNGSCISDTDPSLLNDLFMEYPNVRFDVFHIGYPYQHVTAALGKLFPNVYLDMCWAHILSPGASVRTLSEWLDTVPLNKIIAFGGDYHMVDAVYGHQLMARMNVSKVLADKLEEGLLGMDEAKWIAQRIFYQNPKALYGV